MDLDILKACGIDWQKGVARCLNDRSLFERTLLLFLQDDCFDRGKAAFALRDYPGLYRSMHELKGACGNVEMTALHDAVCELVDLLRGGNEPGEEELMLRFAAVEAAYETARTGILLACKG